MAEKQKLTSLEDHMAKHLKLAQKLQITKDKNMSSTIASFRSGAISDGKVRSRHNADIIRAGFRQEMKKRLGGG